jgi:protein-disulfide isomerase
MDDKNSTSADIKSTKKIFDLNNTLEEKTISFKRTHLYATLLPLAFVAGLSVGFLFWGRDAPNSKTDEKMAPTSVSQAAAPAQGAAPTQQAVKRYDIPEDDDPSIGPNNAPITIIEFSDYECGYCQRWHQEVFPRILADYPDQVRIIYRDFPLTSIHPSATSAAESANCATEQDAFWDYHDLLFSTSKLDKETYLQFAKDLKLDLDEFETCLNSGRYREEVELDYQFAASMGIQSTPTFFLNGLPIIGAQPYDIFKKIIDSELAGEIP